MGLDVSELLAVRQILEDDLGDGLDPLVGVREPRDPKPSSDEAAVAKEIED